MSCSQPQPHMSSFYLAFLLVPSSPYESVLLLPPFKSQCWNNPVISLLHSDTTVNSAVQESTNQYLNIYMVSNPLWNCYAVHLCFSSPFIFLPLSLFSPTFCRHCSNSLNHRTNTSNYTLSWRFSLLTSKSLCLQFINNGFIHNTCSILKSVVPVQTLANQINITDNLQINSIICDKKIFKLVGKQII